MWDKMDEIKEDMETMRNNMPTLEEQVLALEQQLAFEKRKTSSFNIYKGADADGSVSISYLKLKLKLIYNLGCTWIQNIGTEAQW